MRFIACRALARCFLPGIAVVFSSLPLGAQTAGAPSTIEGRVQHRVTGDSLNNARVAIKGTNLVTQTDESGTYRLTNVPPGAATLRVFFTGLDEAEALVTAVSGQTIQQDFKLTSRARFGDSGTVMLDAFKVQSTRETDAAAIAVNEQRMALGQKSVVSADQFGTIPDSNPGELMKWLPGVSVEYFANNITGVSVRGLDAASTEIAFDGMPIASASSTGRDRNFEMLGSSAADIARVEVRKLRTPEDSANALGGSINLVRRSAFEADKRRLTYNVLFTTDASDFSFGDRPGIRDSRINGWRPNFKLTWTDPLSKTFGYAVTLSHNDVLARVHWSSPTWNYGTAAQAASAAARVAANQPLTTVSVYNPQLGTDLLHDNPKQDITDSASIKFDWRPFRELKMSYSLSGSRYQERAGDEVRFTWATGNQANTNLNSVLGAPGTNGLTADGSYATYGGLGAGTIRYDLREGWRNGIKPVITNAIEGEWRKGNWTVAGRGSYSTSKHTFSDVDDGFFQSTTMNGSTLPNTGIGTGSANPRAVTVNLLQRDYKMSHDIRAYAHTAGATTPGPEVNWQDLNNINVGGAVSRQARTRESIAATRLWAKHSFRTRNPFNVRLGFDYNDQFRNVQAYDARLWTFVGRDGVAGTADDNAAQIAAVNVTPSRDTYYGAPAVPRISLRRLYDLYKANPTWFQYRDAESHRFSTTEPYQIDEQTTAGFLEFTGAFFRNRLSYIGGVRYEKAEASGRGVLDRGTRAVAGITDPVQAAIQRYVRKGASGEGGNDGWFPSLQLNYNLTENLILRTGYAKTQAKNRFGRSVIPSSTLDLNPVTTGTYAGIAQGTVNRPNPNLQPWTADNFETHLEYYSRQGGVISAGAFRKNIENVQVQRNILLDTREKLDLLDLEPTFLNFQSTTWINDGVGRIDGAEFEVRQLLNPFVPEFARGFTFTGSFNYNNLSKFNYAGGNIGTDFQNFYQRQIKASVAFRRGKFSGNIGVIENGKVYRQRDDAAGFEGHRYYPAYTTVDFGAEYGVTRWAKLFVSGRNITDAQKLRRRDVQNAPEWSTFHIANNLGVTYTAGITGSF
ncbi:TonB-dependent receptor domain-containing protein [Horticoccus sp. 23ND18S-11]|uniref:TonB-dependent receptor domain-containing protein n=1 Tax=Horticoccus sp. 23ND18S-11 TaxID=3391832 RepID=UPI0039C8F84A